VRGGLRKEVREHVSCHTALQFYLENRQKANELTEVFAPYSVEKSSEFSQNRVA
jgi:hypothetical protein